MHSKLVFALAVAFLCSCSAESQAPVRVGIIGLDTSHVIVFTNLLNNASAPDHVPGARVVAAYKGGSPDIESSASRIDKYTEELRSKWNIEIVPDIPTLCSKVDAILLESVDGRPHLEQVKPVFAARKRVFIDKPLAASLADAKAIAELGHKTGTPWFSASSLRFHPAVQALKADAKTGTIMGADTYSPFSTEPHHPDLFWYGIHGVEILYTLMGPGCLGVTRVATENADITVGRWSGGRLGTFRGIPKGRSGYGATVFGSDGIQSAAATGSPYRGLMTEIVKFFQTGVPPINPDETLEMMAFMEAADASKASGREAALPGK